MRTIRRVTASLRGRPMTFKRHITRIDQYGKAHGSHPPDYRNWQKIAAEKLAAMAGYGRIEGPVAVEIVLSAGETRVAVWAAEGQAPRPAMVTGDIDNYAKAILDALQVGKVIGNDRQVVSLSVRFGGEDADQPPTETL